LKLPSTAEFCGKQNRSFLRKKKMKKTSEKCSNRVDRYPDRGDYIIMMRNTAKKQLDFTNTIDACYANAAAHKLGKIITRADKKGLSGMIEFEISEPRLETNQVDRLVVDIAVSGIVPSIDGWEFVGKLTHDAGDFVAVMTAPGMEIPSKYRDSTGECDHCGRIRNRKDTFVLLNDGEYQEVGRTCLKDFFPTVDVEWIIQYFNYIEEMVDYGEDYDFGTERGVKVRPSALLTSILEISNAVIRRDGWMSKSAAEKIMDRDPDAFILPTAYTISSEMDIIIFGHRAPKNHVPLDITDTDKEIAEKVIDFVRNKMFGNNDYVYNMKNFFSSDTVETRYVPFVASAIAAYTRSVEKDVEKKATKAISTYVGTVGDKISAEVEVTMAKSVSSNFGQSMLYKFVDATGNTYSTFSSSYKFAPEIGDKLKISGTVKSHDEFKGFKSTMLKRVKEA